MSIFYCKCGLYTNSRRHLVEHIALLNAHWPRSTPDDQHAQVSKQDYWARRNASYQRLANNKD